VQMDLEKNVVMVYSPNQVPPRAHYFANVDHVSQYALQRVFVLEVFIPPQEQIFLPEKQLISSIWLDQKSF
jgi:hypothetical protein